MRKACVFAGLAVTMAAACTAPTSANGAPQFLCSVSGIDKMQPAMSEAAICAAFKDRIDAARGNASESVKSLALAGDGDWLKLEVRVTQGRSAAAVLTQKSGAKQHAYPEIVIDVMDKAIGRGELEKLAAEVAKLVGEY